MAKFAKLVCLPTLDQPVKCKLCDSEHTDITEHIIMYCTELTDHRNSMWDDMVDTLDVEDFVNIWPKPEEDILDILLDGKWEPLRDTELAPSGYEIARADDF